jgi:ribosomal RNA-processing protein 17
VDVSKEGLHKITEGEDTEEEVEEEGSFQAINANAKVEGSRKIWPKKSKKKKFRYESKVQRKVTRAKQKAGNRIKSDARRGKD